MTHKEIMKMNKVLKAPFSKLHFQEEGHKYWVDGDTRKIKSVSALLKHLYEPFDTDGIAPKWASDRGLEVEQVKLAWEGEGLISTTHGSAVHLIGEDYVRWKYLKECEKPLPIDKKSLGAIQFINDLPDYLVPVATELQMYSPTDWYCGTCDGIIYNTQTKKFILYDYKTNNALTDSFKKSPLFHVDPRYGLIQDNFGKYSAQFSFYQMLLKEAGFEVQSRVLVWLNEDKYKKKLYRTFKTKDIAPDLKEFLKLNLHL